MNWLAFVTKLPAVVAGIVKIISNVKSASPADKGTAVIAAISDSEALAEFAAGHAVLNDAAVQGLLKAVVDAETALTDARAALKAGILAHPAAQAPQL